MTVDFGARPQAGCPRSWRKRMTNGAQRSPLASLEVGAEVPAPAPDAIRPATNDGGRVARLHPRRRRRLLEQQSAHTHGSCTLLAAPTNAGHYFTQSAPFEDSVCAQISGRKLASCRAERGATWLLTWRPIEVRGY